MSKFEEMEMRMMVNILDEELYLALYAVCKESIDDVTEKFLRDRPKPPQDNPLLYTVLHLIDATVDDEVRQLAIESIDMIVDEHFTLKNCESVFDEVASDIIHELVPPVIPECYTCVEEEHISAALLEEVSRYLMIETATEQMDADVLSQQIHRNNIEIHAIKCIAKKTIVRRMLLAHIMMTMISRYEEVLAAHYMRGIAHRILAGRLLKLVKEIERRVEAPKQNIYFGQIMEKLLLSDVQDELVNHLINASLDKEEEIDAFELASRQQSS